MMKLKLKAKPRVVKFKTGKFNKSLNNDTSFSNVPNVENDNTTIEQTVNKYVNKKPKSSLDINFKKIQKPVLRKVYKSERVYKKREWEERPEFGGYPSGGTPQGEEDPGGGSG